MQAHNVRYIDIVVNSVYMPNYTSVYKHSRAIGTQSSPNTNVSTTAFIRVMLPVSMVGMLMLRVRRCPKP